MKVESRGTTFLLGAALLIGAGLYPRPAKAAHADVESGSGSPAHKLYYCSAKEQVGDYDNYTSRWSVQDVTFFSLVKTSLTKANLLQQWEQTATPLIKRDGPSSEPGCTEVPSSRRADLERPYRSVNGDAISRAIPFTPEEEVAAASGSPPKTKVAWQVPDELQSVGQGKSFCYVRTSGPIVVSSIFSSIGNAACENFIKAVAEAGYSNVYDPTLLTFENVERAEQELSNWNLEWVRMSWEPVSSELNQVSSTRKTKTIAFQDPRPSLGQKGYSNNTFDLEYQFINCGGELHIAYSVVEDSVRSKDPTYLLAGTYYKVSAPAAGIESVPLTGAVTYFNTRVGEFADDHAAKALGFGCFTGQTKKIADFKDIWKFNDGKVGTDDDAKRILDEFELYASTVTVLTSNAAEEEIKSGLAKKAADERERSGQAGLEAAAEDRARRKAEREAEFAAKQAKYEQDLAAQQKAVADYEAAQKQMEADKAAAAAKAKAAQEAFAQQQAAHQAELDRYARERAEYEAKVAGQGSVNIP